MRKAVSNQKPHQKKAQAISHARLDELIEEATIDCYNQSEQISGFFCILEEQLEVPFKTKLLGLEVMVEIMAICRRGRNRQNISILELPLPNPKPLGSEWIEAYRRWAGGR